MPSSDGQTPPNFGSHIFDQKHSERIVEESRLTGSIDVTSLGSAQLGDPAGRFGQGSRRSTLHPGRSTGRHGSHARRRAVPPRPAAARRRPWWVPSAQRPARGWLGALGTANDAPPEVAETDGKVVRGEARQDRVDHVQVHMRERVESSPRLKPGGSWLKPPGPQAVARDLRSQHQQGRNRPWRPCWPQRSCPGA